IPGPQRTPDVGQPAISPPVKKGEAPAAPVIYTVSPGHGDDDLAAKPVADPTANGDPVANTLHALLQTKDSPLAPGTVLRSVSVADGLASVDFSQMPIDVLHGETRQTRALTALQKTLGQFPNISRIQISVNGKPVHNFGEFESPGPLDVIRPGVQQAQAGGA
ncbi:MAG: GerMN domain-containing protein, partial [Armatimonadota bacterium]|nr:GerMN domain-containing protein [Armatimonadota bacterium]